MDAFDNKILAQLQQNARQSISAIAESVSLSRSAELASMVELHDVRSQLDKIPNVGKVTTHVVMHEWLA